MAAVPKGKEGKSAPEVSAPVRAPSRPILTKRVVGPSPNTVRNAAGNQAIQRSLQPKRSTPNLSVSKSGDSAEIEADRSADRITSGATSVSIQSNRAAEEIQRKEIPGQTGKIDNRAAAQIPSLRGGGESLSAHLRSFYEPTFGRTLGGVRLHTSPQAADLATSLKSRAFTVGQDVVFGAGQYNPSSADGRSLLSHELTHVVQNLQSPPRSSQLTSSVSSHSHPAETEARRVAGVPTHSITASPRSLIHRDDSGSQSSQLPLENFGTFVLDPSIANVAVPDQMTTHVRIQEPLAFGENFSRMRDFYVELERPVRSAKRLTVFAVPLEEVFETSIEASSMRPMFTDPLPRVAPDIGAQMWTASASIVVTDVSDNLVITESPNSEAVAAGAVVLLETDGGTVLIDAGLQVNKEGLAKIIGDQLAYLVKAHLGQSDLSEAILSPNPPSGYALSHIADEVRILSVRATKDQYDQGTLTEVLRAQSEYRKWYETAVRDQLTAGRTEWEKTQPIAPNESVREQRWNAHLAAELAQALLSYQPPRLLVAEQVGDSSLQMRDEEIAQGPPSDVGAIPDLSDTQWEPADDQEIILFGNKRLTLLSSAGILLRPAATPQPTPQAPAPPPQPQPVSGMRPAGPVGVGPAVARPVTPWMVLATVGKEMHLVVRVGSGLGILIDAGGPRVITLDKFAEISARLGITSIEKILVTHPHFDHVRNLLQLIKDHQIKAVDLVASRSWIDTGTSGKQRLIETLRTTTEQALLDLGYGERWTEPGLAVPAEGVTRLRIEAGQTQIDVYARGAAHEEYQTARSDVRQGRRKTMPSKAADSASFLYVFGNESSANRTAVLGDFRGEDIIEMHRSIGADQFAEAFKNVRVIKGIGHHLSEAAGSTPTDIRGLNLLLEATLLRYGELTVMVQSSERFSFGGPATTAGRAGALLNYLVSQGARVVFAGSVRGDGGTADISSSSQVTTRGTGIQVFEGGDPRVREMHRRLQILREARRTVVESPEFGPTALGLEQRKAAELQQALDTEIQRLEGLARELGGHKSVELLEARGPAVSTLTGPEAAERRAFRSENIVEGRTVEQIIVEMAQQGPVEHTLSPTVLDKIRASLATGRSLGIEIELAATPRAVLEAIERLPEARRTSLAKKYREMAELTSTFETDVLTPRQRLEIMLKAIQLRNELGVALEEAGTARPAALETELARLNSVVEQIRAQSDSEFETSRDPEGRPTRTEYIRMRSNELIQKGFHGLGRGMGAVMVIHSVQELGTVAQDVALGDANLPEAMLRITHSVYGMDIGVRMARTTYKQLTTATGAKVSGWEFGIMAVIEIGAAVAADYKTSEERNAAIAGAAIHSAVNLGCMYVGQAIMNLSARYLHHPIAKLAGMGIGLAIMMGGDRILAFLGLDDDIARWSQFPPGEVTDVNMKINSVLNDYKIIIGSREIQKRPLEDLKELGVKYPYSAQEAAGKTEEDYSSAIQSKERELTSLFEAAYDRTKGSYAGIQMLDQQAAEFLRFRGLAMGSEKYDPNREELDRRWRAMDQRLDLSGATAQQIKEMDQWNDLDEKLTELAGIVLGNVIEPDKLFENLDEAQMMIENARYRLNPGTHGLRTKPLIPEGTEAYRVYRELLLQREIRLAGFHGYFMRLAGHQGNEPVYKYDQVDPRTAFVRLRTVANDYREQVVAVSAQLRHLSNPKTWATPAEFARQVEKANREHPLWFRDLRLAEKTLEIATRQAGSALMLASPPPEPALRKLIEDEIEEAKRSMKIRREGAGLVFLPELDALLEERGTDEDKITAAQLQAAYPTEKMCKAGPEPPPFTETEVAAMHTDAFTKHGGELLTSNEKQLAEVRRIMAPWRQVTPGVDAMRDWDKLTRVVERQYMILPNPYEQWDPDAKLDHLDEYHYDPSLTPIVALLQTEIKSLYWGAFTKVLPINADAVRVMGRGTRDIRTLGGKIIKEEQILDEAKKKHP